MADVVLSNGDEITFDLSKITRGQWKSLFNENATIEGNDITIARVAGLDKLDELTVLDYKMIVKGFFKKLSEPLADPNSPSESG